MVKILIADDDVISLQVLKAMLSRDGFEIVAVNNGNEALQQAESNTFSLILLDYDMPDMTGAEVCAKLQQQSDQSTPPVIAVTGHDNEAELSQCRAAGMVATLHKPIAPDALENILSQWLP